MSRAANLGRTTFAALSIQNYRRFLVGQVISMAGSWMQSVAQAWLVLQLTHSATALGLVISLQMLPILLFGSYGGVLADRMDKRKLIIGLDSVMLALAAVLGVLSYTGAVHIWHVYALAVLLGMTNCIEQPTRQSFVQEMVGGANLRNAVGLSSAINSAARAVGPAVAGVTIATAGVATCFFVNAISYLAVLASLLSLDVTKLFRTEPVPRAKGQVREGFRYARRTPSIAVPFVMIAIVGCLAYEFQVTLPVLAKETFHGDAKVFGYMTSAMGVGSVVGGLLVAAKGRTGIRTLVVLVAVFGVAMFGLTFSPNLLVAIVVLFVIGNLSIAFVSIANSTMQLTADPQMRGRVIALWSIGFFGMTPVGALLIGAISQHFGPRVGIGIGAVACFVSAGLGEYLYRRVLRRRVADAAPSPARVVDPVRIVGPERAIDGREPVPSGRAATG